VSDDLPDWLQALARAARDVDAESLTRFLPPDDGTGRASAVLIAFTDGPGGPSVLLIERAADMRKHAGQVAFPGGALDATDASARHAALREAEEEVGLDPASVRVVAELPDLFIPVSGFVVTPVIAWWQDPHEVRAVDEAEVARVAIVPIDELTDPANRFSARHPLGFTGPGFDAAGLYVWGFTAMLLDKLLEIGGWARPWDSSIERPLPPGMIASRSS
jgi:8-oxo-dGTP pyrophosphatase MutT (NUDIX family)